MDITQMLACIGESLRHAGLFDVHVIRVEVDKDILRTHTLDQLGTLPRGVQKVGLIAVAGLDPEFHVEVTRLAGNPFDKAADRVKLCRGHRRARALAYGAICNRLESAPAPASRATFRANPR